MLKVNRPWLLRYCTHRLFSVAMAYTAKGLGALLVGAAVAQGVDLHFQSEIEMAGKVEFVDGAEFVAGVELAGGADFIATHQTVVATFDGEVMSGAPEWCKNTSELTWKQRKERMQQHATLEWCKGQVKKLREENESIPDWMGKIVGDDQKNGKMKWASAEAKRLIAEEKEVPAWMQDLMNENARRGIMEYSSEKEANLEEEMEDLSEEADR